MGDGKSLSFAPHYIPTDKAFLFEPTLSLVHNRMSLKFGGADLRKRFFKFIFLNRSWAADRANLTKALTNLGKQAKGSNLPDSDERSSLLATNDTGGSVGKGRQGGKGKRSPLWLFIFPEGTITSDEERVKSKRYAEKEGIVSLHHFIRAYHQVFPNLARRS